MIYGKNNAKYVYKNNSKWIKALLHLVNVLEVLSMYIQNALNNGFLEK